MVDIDLNTENVKNSDGIQGSGYPREPSFSGWCEEDGVIPSDIRLHDRDPSTEEFHFELPLPRHGKGNVERERDQQKKIQLEIMPMTGAIHRDHVSPRGANHVSPRGANHVSPLGANHVSPRGAKHGNRNFMPLDIENGSAEENKILDHRDNGSNFGDNFGTPATTSKSLISHVDVLKTLFFILVWYTFSTFLTLYNKSLLGDDLGKFPAPLLMNTVHFTMQAVLSKGIVWFWPQRFQATVPMSWKDYFFRVVPTALGTALDINLSNASLVFISVTFATMCKSAAPIFLLMFAFAFRLESPSYKLLGIIFIISVGILLTVAKETEFEVWGFIFVMLAAVMSGFRWTMTQILLQKEVYGLKNPLTLMSYVTPVMAVSTAILSLAMDPWDEFGDSSYFNGSWSIMRSCLLMLFGGTLAFFMVLTEYILISVTSAVTVTIAGVVKEAVTIVVAVFYFHDEFTWLKGVGLLIIMLGVSLFNWYKYQKLQEGKLGEEDAARSSAAKYVILDEMDDEDEGQRELGKM